MASSSKSCSEAMHFGKQAAFQGIRVAGRPANTRWDVCCKSGIVSSIEEYMPGTSSDEGYLGPSLCHPHIHLDKCFLLSHPKYEDLEIKEGNFAEALSLTNQAKSRFEHDDLMERGRALIEESMAFGVTHMRAFVEVDEGVGMKCLDAGLSLKEEFRSRCYVQICVFAQDPILSYPDDCGEGMQDLLEEAIARPGVEVLGSTPYVETGGWATEFKNLGWTIAAALEHNLHLDFHLDYNLDGTKEPLINAAINLLKHYNWPTDPNSPDFRTVVFGHCTRLTLFDEEEWKSLAERIENLPISFVGLPTSDLFMMGRPEGDAGGGERMRGTLQVPQMIQKYGLNGVIGINNVGNAFTPYGTCDPLSLASLGVGLYQAGTKVDADILLQCVSSRAKSAIGLGPAGNFRSDIEVGDSADLVVYGAEGNQSRTFRSRKSVQELVYDAGHERITIFGGRVVSGFIV